MKPKILLAILFCCTGCLLFSQNDGEIVGKVMDSLKNEPLYFASVSLEQNGNIITQTSADAFGEFIFKPVKAGVYTVVISFTGYQLKTFENVKVHSGEMNYRIYALSSENVLPVFEVIADDIIIDPLIGREIDPVTIKHSPPSSIQEIVTKTISEIYSPDGGENGALYIQGSRADATLYVIDGVRVDGSGYIPKSAIASITVYAGGIPAKYGDVTGGVIEVTTKSFSGVY